MVAALLADLEASGLGQMARSSRWLYPAANLLHVLGAALLVGGMAVLDILLIRGRAEAADAVGRVAIPLAVLGIVLQVTTGVVLLAAEATAVGRNPAFLAKLGLILVGLANVAAYHAWRRRTYAHRAGPARLRLHGGLSLAVWVAVLLAGRAIAYL
ncbi:hypothetical protein [Prosthecomicrobium sp. N25]|uniref:hypothetical protein n=1 Tax=Prosthecomicrobium sp. N25 TaxID=3129254 RepID=UPI003077AB03